MALDFRKLPPEEPVPAKPRSLFLWIMASFMIAVLGVFAVLFLWPQGELTGTPWFWTCVVVYPFGIATFVVLRCYSIYEGRRLDAVAWNKARDDYLTDVFERESQPLAVIAASYRFSSEAEEDEFGKLLDGSVKLEPRMVPRPDTPPVNARWFDKPDADTDGNRFNRDDVRQRYVVAWAFRVAIEEVAQAVRSLPTDVNLSVQLLLPDALKSNEVLAAWDQQWEESNLGRVNARVLPECPDLTYVDTWLDEINRNLNHEVRLLVCVRLNSIHQAPPPDGSAESVVVILITPDAVRRAFSLASIALLHRPTGTNDCSTEVALDRALQWGRAEPAAIKRVWQGGLDVATENAATAALVRTGIATKPTNIDYMVGHVGAAAPWLAMACAAISAQHGTTDLILTSTPNGACFSVARHIDT